MTAKKRDDVVLLGPELPTGKGRFVLRKRGEKVETGAIRAAEEGKPIVGELVSLRPREGEDLYDVEVLHDGRPPAEAEDAPEPAGRKGPAKVATDAYRSGWGRVFAKTKAN